MATWDCFDLVFRVSRLKMAPGEMIEVIQQTANSGGLTRITLHCLGHSMGGLIVRGALPILMEKLNNVDLGSLAEIGKSLSQRPTATDTYRNLNGGMVPVPKMKKH